MKLIDILKEAIESNLLTQDDVNMLDNKGFEINKLAGKVYIDQKQFDTKVDWKFLENFLKSKNISYDIKWDVIYTSRGEVKKKEIWIDPKSIGGSIKPKKQTQAKPESNQPEWIDPKSKKAKILVNVYYIGDGAEGDFRGLAGSAVPEYELQGYTLRDIKKEGDGFLYIKKGETGWYDENKQEFESENENSTVGISKKYIQLI